MATHEFTITPEPAVTLFLKQIEATLATFRAVMTAHDSGSLNAASLRTRPGSLVTLEVPAPAAAAVVQKASLECFLNMVRATVEFADRMLAFRAVRWRSVRLTADLPVEDLPRFIEQLIENEYQTVAQDRSRGGPKKLEQLGLSDELLAVGRQLFEVRRCLEHHSARPARDLVVQYPVMGITIDGKLVESLPTRIQKGQTLGASTRFESLQLPQGRTIVLGEDLLEGVFVWLNSFLAPATLKAVMEYRPAEGREEPK